ncbi:regulatory protein RecX [Microbacterium sp. GXS0129]|uniref:regulatory protein RecX n=1 Tax=Microbacterium sp. GXS0129 TaxID=3377836 RepID=UPI00383A1619
MRATNGADVGERDNTPPLMRASDLLKPDGERSSQPVALPTRGWRDSRSGESSADDRSSSPHAHGDRSSRPPGEVVADHGERSAADATAAEGSDLRAGLDARPSRPAQPARAPRLRLLESSAPEPDDHAAPEDPQTQRERGEAALLKKLRGRGLSVREARAFVIGLDIAPEIADDLVDEFLSLRYLDDAVLAEQLIYTATSRKGQGRRVIAQSLSARGIPREVIDAALEELPDDDDERALEFARSKARSLAKLEPEVALRRLLGQLARRGFGGSSAMRAAKTALSEAGGSTVRFR